MSITTPSVTYCNLTTDLIRAYFRVYDFITTKQITDWTLTTGQASTYQNEGCGYVSAVFEDSVPLTEKTSIATVEATASTFWYDSTNDILYVHTTAGSDPDGNYTIEAGVNKSTFLTQCRAIAQTEFESMLSSKFPRPLPMARSQNGYLARDYDDDIIHCVAKLTCAIAVSAFNPRNQDADDITARLRNEAHEIINAHNEGIRKFSFENTGQVNIIPLSVSGEGMIELAGEYDGDDDILLRVKIVTGGAIGTATYQYSTDNGTTYSGTDITTAATWVLVTKGLYIRFDARGSTGFTANDTWQIRCESEDRPKSRPKIGTIDIIA